MSTLLESGFQWLEPCSHITELGTRYDLVLPLTTALVQVLQGVVHSRVRELAQRRGEPLMRGTVAYDNTYAPT